MAQTDRKRNKVAGEKAFAKANTNTESIPAVNESEKKLSNLIEFADDGILIGSHEGYITEANSCFCEITGRKKEDLIGKDISLGKFLFTSESIENAPFRFDLLKKGETIVSEREILRPDGSTLMVEMRTKMMSDGSYQSIFRDITGQKTKETQLRKYAEELRKLNADKDLFISILAHDLSNHFNSIIAFLDILKNNFRKFTKKETEDQIKIAHGSAETAFSLLQDFLVWTKAQSGFIHFEPKILRFVSICNDVQNNLKYYAKGKNITLHCRIPDDLEVKADVQMMKTVLRNLITNAIKFTPPRGKIEVFAEKKENMVEITVSDNGVGIEPDIQEKLFKDFSAFSTEGTNGEKGSGLGLLICKICIEKHDGKIWAESTPGKGSNFKFTVSVP